MSKITFGADPEFFISAGEVVTVTDPATDLKRYVHVGLPSWKFFGGTKGEAVELNATDFDFSRNLCDRPSVSSRSIARAFERIRVLCDGPTVEFNAVEPYPDLETLRADMVTMWRAISAHYKPFMELYDPNSRSMPALIDHSIAVFYDEEVTRDPRFTTVGCDPDMDAIKREDRVAFTADDFYRMSTPKGVGTFRHAGGHIHIGVDPWPSVPKHIFVRLLACIYQQFVGAEDGALGASMYRQAGLYREKPYGIEYRSPATSWITADASHLGGRIEQLVHALEAPDTMMRLASWHRDSWEQAPNGVLEPDLSTMIRTGLVQELSAVLSEMESEAIDVREEGGGLQEGGRLRGLDLADMVPPARLRPLRR